MTQRYSVVGQQMIDEARSFATAAHYAIGQVRKYTNEPYIEHPKRVAELVQSVNGHSWHMVAAAWLHDVVEDTKVPLSVITDIFGGAVGMMVMHLTNVPLSEGNRKTRFDLNLQKLSLASDETKTIKLADLIDNTASIVRHDRSFATVYLTEKEKTLEVLKGGDLMLWRRAQRVLQAGQQELLDVALAR
jgi:(p)ppGpp synthase/HD superfamily hydrolase